MRVGDSRGSQLPSRRALQSPTGTFGFLAAQDMGMRRWVRGDEDKDIASRVGH
jgi:hypothetical protein